MTTVLVICAAIGAALLLAAFLHEEIIPGLIGLALVLLAIFPEQMFKLFLGAAALYFVYWMLIGAWL